MKFLTQWLLVLLTVLNPMLASAALTDYDRQELAVKNWLAPFNSGFESGKAKWTASGGTLAAVTSGTNLLVGKGSATWDSGSAAQTLTSQTITIEKGYYGQNCEAGIVAQTPSGTATHTVQAYDGTNILVSATIVNSTTPRLNTVNFPCPQSGTVALRLVSVAADEPLIAIDDAYLGLARNVGSTQLISEPTSYTPTIGLTGGTTSASAKWQRIGPDIEVWGDATFTTVFTGGAATVSLPSVCTIDTTKFPTTPATGVGIIDSKVYFYDVGSGQYGGTVTYNDTSTVLLRTLQDDVGAGGNHVFADAAITTTIPFTWANNDRLSFRFKVPCQGWTAQTTASIDAISKRGSAYFATGNATTTSGSSAAFNNASFSSPTLEGQALTPTTANDVGIRLTNAPAGVYEVNAVGWFYAYRASGETGTNCAYDLYDGASSRGESVAGAPNVSGVSTLDGIGALSDTFTLASAGTINVVLRGKRTSGTGACYVDGPISISIKNVSQNSPAIVIANSVSTSAKNGLKTESFSFTCSGSSSIGVQLGGTSWVSSVGNIAAGVCAVGISAGTFSGSPQCQATWTGGGSNAVVYTYAETSSGFNVGAVTDTGIAASSFTGKAMCVGPR